MTNLPNEIGIGMLGYAFMGKAHSNAFKKLPYIAWPPPLVPGGLDRLAAAARDRDQLRTERDVQAAQCLQSARMRLPHEGVAEHCDSDRLAHAFAEPSK